MTYAERKNLVEGVRKHILWIASIYPDNVNRALDESYGFVQGVIFAHKDDEAFFNDMQDMWIKTGDEIRFGRVREV